MTLIIDASVAVKWGVLERDAMEAKALVGGEDRLVAPDLVIAEVANTLWKKTRRGELLETEHAAAMAACVGAFDELSPARDLAHRALALAVELDHPAYDCFYLALAEEREAVLVTADRRFAERLRTRGWKGQARLLGA